MPVQFTPLPPSTQCAIICQTAAERLRMGKAPRYIVLFLVGRFSLEEANSFAVDLFDGGEVPDGYHYFNETPDIRTVGFTAVTPPDELQYLINHFSVNVSHC